jgi:hypothetical protein
MHIPDDGTLGGKVLFGAIVAIVILCIDVSITNDIYDYCKTFEAFANAPGMIHFFSWTGMFLAVVSVVGVIVQLIWALLLIIFAAICGE